MSQTPRSIRRQRIVSAPIAPARGFLRELPLAERAILFMGAQTVRFQPGEIIFKEGDPAGGLYLLRSGRVRLSVREVDRETVLGIAKAGDTLGELAALDGGPRTATAQALSTAAADYIPRELFTASLSSTPAAAVRLLHRMAERLRRTDPHVGELTSLEREIGSTPAGQTGRPSAARPLQKRG
jgi:CRP-like cAMP-binding protein